MGYFTDFMLLGTYLNSGDAAESASEVANYTEELLRIKEEQLFHIENQKDLKQLIFSINKKFKRLEISENDIEYRYIELFFIMKELNDCGIIEEDFDELADKQYFLDMTLSMESCAKNYVKEMGEEKLKQANQYINAVLEYNLVCEEIESEKAKIELEKIEHTENDRYNILHKRNQKRGFILGLIGAILIAIAAVVLILSEGNYIDFEFPENFTVILICFGLIGLIFISLIPIFCITDHDRGYLERKEELEKIIIDESKSNPELLNELKERKKVIDDISSNYGNDFTNYLMKTYNI